MKGNTLYNVADPVNPQDVAMKEYPDKMVNNVGKYVDEKMPISRLRWTILQNLWIMLKVD